MEDDPTVAIDQSLKENYHAICFNPYKKEVLQKITRQHEISPSNIHYSNSKESQNPHELISNKLVNNYIKYVYSKYQLEDPIQKQFRLNNHPGQNESMYQNTPEKNHNLSMRQSTKPSSTKDKLERMRNSYKQDSSQILYTTQYHSQAYRSSQIHSARPFLKPEGPFRQIGYRTKEKIKFKTHNNEDIPNNSREKNNQSFYLEQANNTSNLTQRQLQSREWSHNGDIPMIFRYCPMCQEVVLQHNILHHQQTCQQIKKAYDLPLEQLQAIFKFKVQRMKAKIEDLINCEQGSKIQEYRDLNRSVFQWLQTDNDHLFMSVKDSYEKMALNQYYLLTKLDWFKKLLSKIKRQRQQSFNR